MEKNQVEDERQTSESNASNTDAAGTWFRQNSSRKKLVRILLITDELKVGHTFKN